MSDTRRRRKILLALARSASLETQEAIAAALAERGFEASQASVSRDIAALGLVKIDGRYAPRPAGAAHERDPFVARLRDNVLEARRAGDHLMVLVTPPGEASPVAIAIDAQSWPGVIGTVAGDDTIFVALAGEEAGRELRRRLRRAGAAI